MFSAISSSPIGKTGIRPMPVATDYSHCQQASLKIHPRYCFYAALFIFISLHCYYFLPFVLVFAPRVTVQLKTLSLWVRRLFCNSMWDYVRRIYCHGFHRLQVLKTFQRLWIKGHIHAKVPQVKNSDVIKPANWSE